MKHLYRTLSICILLAWVAAASAQSPAYRGGPPSAEEIRQQQLRLEAELKSAVTDTARVRLRLLLAGLVARDQFAEGLQQAKDALALAEKTGHAETRARAYFGVGNICLNAGRLDDALLYLNQGLLLAENIGRPDLTAPYYTHLGRIYNQRGVYEKSLAYYLKAVQALEQSEAPPERRAAALNQVGILLDKSGKHREAVEYLRRGVALAEQSQAWNMAASMWDNLAGCYDSQANAAEAEASRARAADCRARDKKKAPLPARGKSGNN